MKIVDYQSVAGTRLGVNEGDSIVELQTADPKLPSDLVELLAKNDLKSVGEAAKKAPASAKRPLAGLKFALPVARGAKIICLGLNYMDHVKEGRYADNVPKFPTLFMRGLNSFVPHLAPLMRP